MQAKFTLDANEVQEAVINWIEENRGVSVNNEPKWRVIGSNGSSLVRFTMDANFELEMDLTEYDAR